MSNLTELFHWYLSHQEELVEQYNGKVLVIKDNQVVGAYDDYATAVKESSKIMELGTFLVQRCTPGESDYTQTYYNHRVSFCPPA